MKTFKTLALVCLVFLGFLAIFGNARAATLSQTSVYLSQGQSTTVYASNISTSLYIYSNSNPSVASVSVSGTSINIYGIATGTTTATICENNQTNCNSIYINVNNNGNNNYSNLSLSQTNLSLTVGQTSVVTSYNYYGTLYVSSNSNSSIATTYVNGNSVSIYGNNSGNTNIIICQNSTMSACSTVYVNVTGGSGYNNGYGNGYYGYTSSGILDLNISNLSLPVGGSITVGASSSNPAGIYASDNSNSNVVSVSYSPYASGCTGNATYSAITGLPCYGSTYNTAYMPYYSNSYSSVAGCTASSMYSYLTGQPCYGNNNIYNSNYAYGYIPPVTNNAVSIIIRGLIRGSGNVTICQNGANTCTAIPVSVY